MTSWARGARPLVLGHRGARHVAPENTLAAFEEAVRQGADGVELDVRLDTQGSVVVLHDRTLARTTGWHDVRDVETLSSHELARSGVPTLDEVLDWAARGRYRVNVELKRDVSDRQRLVEAVVRSVARLPDPEHSVLFSSFHPGMVAALSRRLPNVTTAWLVHAGQRLLCEAPGFRWLGARAVNPEHVLATPARVRRWKSAGALVNVWTVNDPARAVELAALGVDAIISDVPSAIVAALG